MMLPNIYDKMMEKPEEEGKIIFVGGEKRRINRRLGKLLLSCGSDWIVHDLEDHDFHLPQEDICNLYLMF